MKNFTFGALIIVIVLILIIAFENIYIQSQFLILFSTINTVMTIPLLLSALLGSIAGALAVLYFQGLSKKDGEEEEEL